MGVRVGFIGTGIMGAPMCLNLLKAGHDLVVSSRTKSRALPLMEAGAKWADSVTELAGACDVVFTCLPDTPDVKKVLTGKGGIIEAARRGLICVDTSTINPAATIEMSKTLAAKGVMLLDAPVSGGQMGAIQGKLSMMVGGPKDAFEKTKPVMAAMASSVVWCGESGAGHTTKLVNQVTCVNTMMGVAEGLALAEKAGLDLKVTLDALMGGSARGFLLDMHGHKAIAGDNKPGFTVDLELKDLGLVLEYAKQIGQPLPGVELVRGMFLALKAAGRGPEGTQCLIDAFRALRKK
jgi:3-hydroxyisobutyrate dehydrogenase-like beta-hydroxyacid dehydrogenase